MSDYDNWKLAAPNEDAPPLNAECAECGAEDYSENLTCDLCESCVAKFEKMEEQCEECGELNTALDFKDDRCTDCQPAVADFGECPDSFDARMARNKEEAEIIEHGLRSDHD